MRWEPVQEFTKLGGVGLLLQMVAMAAEWGPYTGKYVFSNIYIILVTDKRRMCSLLNTSISIVIFFCRGETIRSALDVLSVCTVTPKTQLLLCESILLPENVSTPAIRYFALYICVFNLVFSFVS